MFKIIDNTRILRRSWWVHGCSCATPSLPTPKVLTMGWSATSPLTKATAARSPIYPAAATRPRYRRSTAAGSSTLFLPLVTR